MDDLREQCRHRYIQGKRQGKQCYRVALAGEHYCQECITQTVVLPLTNSKMIRVFRYNYDQRLYYDPEHGFIVAYCNDKSTAVGRFHYMSGTIKDLSMRGKQLASRLGFYV